MQKICVLILLILMLLSCSDEQCNTQNIMLNQLSGNDKDAYGCIASAGYQWSVLRNECIRVFEVGVSLTPQDKGLDQSLYAFIIFHKEASDIVEVFIPYIDESLILSKMKTNSVNQSWQAGTYMLQLKKGLFFLTKNDRLLYRGVAKR